MNQYENQEIETLHAKQEDTVASLEAEKLEIAATRSDEVAKLGLIARIVEVSKDESAKYGDEIKRREIERLKALALILLVTLPLVGVGTGAGVIEKAILKAKDLAQSGHGSEGVVERSESTDGTGSPVENGTQKPTRLDQFIRNATSKDFQEKAKDLIYGSDPLPDVPKPVIERCTKIAKFIPEAALIPPVWQYLHSTYKMAIIEGTITVDGAKEVAKYAREKLEELKAKGNSKNKLDTQFPEEFHALPI